MYQFEDLAQLQSTLERLAAREQPLVAVLPRLPGSREARWTHLLGDPAERPSTQSFAATAADPTELEALRATVVSLETRIAALEVRLQALEPRSE
jgi:uncharacterized protein YceH (UPF0502 family)